MKRYELQGIENHDYICDFCGKKHISRCFVVLDRETGEVKRFGSSCIVRALGVSMKEIKADVARQIEEIRHEYYEKIYPISSESRSIMAAYRKAHDYPIGFLPESEKRYWELAKEETRLTREMNDKIYKLQF